MPEKLNSAIIAQYPLYQKIRIDKKHLVASRITLLKDPNHNGGITHSENVVHPELTPIHLIIDAHAALASNYAFKLRAQKLCNPPFFRFDAAGGAHNNTSPVTPLAESRVNTPHFQYYDEAGYNIAYQTSVLKNEAVLDEIRRDINAGMRVFCDESNTFVIDGSVPVISTPGVGSDPMADFL